MTLKHPLTQSLFKGVKQRNKLQREFHQAVHHFLETIDPYIEDFDEFDESTLKRFLEPDRIIGFKVTWVDDQQHVQVNRGYRVQFNNALGPYKGGLRFHPSVTPSIIKFLGFDQTLKNALTDLLLGGAKGGSDFDPKGKSDGEIMRFCQAFIRQLNPYIGPDWDVPAGDIGVGYRELGYMVGALKQFRQSVDGTLTGKPVGYGGSLVRKEATGYGLCYFVEALLNHYHDTSFQDKKVVISGSGNVAIYAAEKVTQLGGKVIAMSDSAGYVYDEQGIDISIIKDIKETQRKRIKQYVESVPHAQYVKKGCIWCIKCDVALPCATQNEMDLDAIKLLHDNNVLAIGEGANMPLTAEAIAYAKENNMLLAPGIAANAGGVAVSALEMSQNASKLMWDADQVDGHLKQIMTHIFKSVVETSEQLKQPSNLILGAQLTGYLKVARAMKQQGVF